jgi:hypothetical protein
LALTFNLLSWVRELAFQQKAKSGGLLPVRRLELLRED